MNLVWAAVAGPPTNYSDSVTFTKLMAPVVVVFVWGASSTPRRDCERDSPNRVRLGPNGAAHVHAKGRGRGREMHFVSG